MYLLGGNRQWVPLTVSIYFIHLLNHSFFLFFFVAPCEDVMKVEPPVFNEWRPLMFCNNASEKWLQICIRSRLNRPLLGISTFDMDNLGKIREHHGKERLKITKIA